MRILASRKVTRVELLYDVDTMTSQNITKFTHMQQCQSKNDKQHNPGQRSISIGRYEILPNTLGLMQSQTHAFSLRSTISRLFSRGSDR